MNYVHWVFPHAIEVNNDTYDTILSKIPIDHFNLQHIMKDALETGTTFYIVAHRMNARGDAEWYTLSASEMTDKYEVEDLDKKFTRNFERI